MKVSTANKKYQAAVIDKDLRRISEMIGEEVVDLIKTNLTVKKRRNMPEIYKVRQCNKKSKNIEKCKLSKCFSNECGPT